VKCVQFSVFGNPADVTEAVEIDDPPPPGADEAVFDVEAFPINPADLLTIEGRYAVRPPLPATLGAEALGRVTAVGANVSHIAVGDRVINMGRDNWCQRKCVPAAQLVPVPGDGDPLQLAMLKVNPATALLMLRSYVNLEPGDWVIQNAANSGVGQNLIRFARAEGIRTLNVVRRGELVAPLTALGADAVLLDGTDLGDQAKEATGGTGAKLAIDAVGGTAVTRLADCLADGGTAVNYGLLSGHNCEMTAHQLVFRQLTLTGFWLQPRLLAMAADERAALYADLAGRVVDGQIHVEVEATYGIDDIKQAVAHAGQDGRKGKILVTPNGPLS
jgi:NADPH:quinone reductase-like Zn-dependent oxidoreductase